MALSRSLHDALKEFAASLGDEDHNKPYALAAVRELRHAETDGLAEYENKASEILNGLFDLQRQHDPDAPSDRAVSDTGEGGDRVAVNK